MIDGEGEVKSISILTVSGAFGSGKGFSYEKSTLLNARVRTIRLVLERVRESIIRERKFAV